jgi:protein SCO1/2
MSPRILIGLSVAGALSVAAIAVGLAGRSSGGAQPASVRPATAERFEGGVMPPGVRAPRFSLRDERGRRFSSGEMHGRPAIVTFLYTNCEESCPAEAQQVKGALDRLASPVPAVAIAVEPPRDTPASARRFLREQGMLGRLRFVLGSRRELEPLWKGYAIQPQLPTSEHQARIVLVDARGMQRVGFPLSEATPERIAHDVRELQREAAAS